MNKDVKILQMQLHLMAEKNAQLKEQNKRLQKAIDRLASENLDRRRNNGATKAAFKDYADSTARSLDQLKMTIGKRY